MKNWIRKKEEFFFWFFLIFLVSFFITFYFICFVILYFYYLFLFFFKKLKIKTNRSKKEVIKVEKNTIEIKKNIYLIFLKQIIWDQANMKSFLILYSQLEIIKNANKKKEFKEISIFLIERILFRIIFINVTGLPLIIVKNVNFIFKIIKDITIFKKTPFSIKIKTVIYNIIIKYNINLALKTKKSKIIILKNKTVLNMKDKDLEILKNLKDLKLWVEASNNLINKGIFTKLKYFSYSKKIPTHPSLYFYNFKKNELLVTNQTTKKQLEILEKFNKTQNNDFLTWKKKIDLELKIKKILSNGEAYMTFPHTIKEEDVNLQDPSDLIIKINNPTNIITKFKFIQSFFINFEFDMYKYNKENGLEKDKNYKNFKEYLIKNIDNFEPEIKTEFIKLIEFYEKNKKFLYENRLNFVELLNKADINIDIKKYFSDLIEKYSK